ncbi:MAG: hypothetical protein ACJ72V_09870, partial [Nitrososphaeraceae archaeon]
DQQYFRTLLKNNVYRRNRISIFAHVSKNYYLLQVINDIAYDLFMTMIGCSIENVSMKIELEILRMYCYITLNRKKHMADQIN